MLCLGRAMDEVPPLQGALLSVDDEERFPGEDEKRLRLGLPVVELIAKVTVSPAREARACPLVSFRV